MVSLIVGYVEEDLEGSQDSALDRAVAAQPDKMKAAALAALELTRDAGSAKTVWHIYDRVTGASRFLEQAAFDSSGTT